jgi:K+ transporter
MLDKFIGKEYPAITVQGVLLASSVLYLEHGGFNLPVILAVVILLSLFVLQAINHRFYYYFPGNRFTGKETKKSATTSRTGGMRKAPKRGR